ncbi:MAG: AtpZ/AtpI family protein [Gemmatimonadota bacterium]
MSRSRGDPESPLVTLARFSGHGLTWAMSTGFFLFLGWLLDGRVGTVPLFTLLGAFLGAAAGFYYILQQLVFLPREAEKQRAREHEDTRE